MARYCPVRVLEAEMVGGNVPREHATCRVSYELRDTDTGEVMGLPCVSLLTVRVGHPFNPGDGSAAKVYLELCGWAVVLCYADGKLSVSHLLTDDGHSFMKWAPYDNYTGLPLGEFGRPDGPAPSFTQSGAKNPLGGDPDEVGGSEASPAPAMDAESAAKGTVPDDQMSEWMLPHPIFTMDLGYDQSPPRFGASENALEGAVEEPTWEDPEGEGWLPGDWADEGEYPQGPRPDPDFEGKGEHVYPPVQQLVESLMWSGVPVYLVGPAGCGKSELVRSASERLGMAFHYSNAIQQEYKLNGFIDAGGVYHETEFYRACTEKGESVFMIDEADASIPEALITINAAMGNGYHEFPVGMVPVGGVHFVACGNTTGDGSDDMYTARAVLDQATMDRFAVVRMGYCRDVEMALAHGDSALVDFMGRLRGAAERNGIRATFSYRTVQNVTAMKGMDLPLTQVLEAVVLKGLPPEHVRVLSREVGGEPHPYADALRTIASRGVPRPKS